MHKATEELLHEIEKTKDIYSFFEENNQELLDMTAKGYLDKMLQEKGLAVSDVIKRSEHGDYIYKVFAGTRKASRDILVAIAFGLSMSVEEIQMLLRLSGTARLDPRNRRDAVTLYALSKKRELTYLNDLLFDMNEATY